MGCQAPVRGAMAGVARDHDKAIIGMEVDTVEPSMGPLRDLVFTGYMAAPFSFESPCTITSYLNLIFHVLLGITRLPSLLIPRHLTHSLSFPTSSYSALVAYSTSAHLRDCCLSACLGLRLVAT